MLFLVFALLAPASAHICLLYPAQRGALNVTTPGDPSCYRRTDYCGGVAPGPPSATLAAGQSATLLVQQNLNHFYPPRPGFIDVAIAPASAPTAWTTLATQPDAPANDMVVQTQLSVSITVPASASASSILRVRYVSYNPLEVDPAANTDAIFYTCADVAIVASAPAAAAQPAPLHQRLAPSAAASDSYNCTTPASWSANFTETNEFGVVQHAVWWDAGRRMTRWDRLGSLTAAGPSALSLINDYSRAAPVEWVNFLSAGACYAYGSDAFYQWGYGPGLGMAHAGRAAGGVDAWEPAAGPSAAPYSWQSRDLGEGLCAPLAWTRGRSSVVAAGFLAGPIDASVFVPQAECTKAPVFAGCHAGAMEAHWRAGRL